MQNRTVEITVGVFVVAGLAALVLLAMQVSNLSALGNDDGYTLTAKFRNIGGLKVRSLVSMAGVKIGRVTDIGLDGDTHWATVSMNIQNSQKLPADSVVSIYTAGLLGEQYVAVVPGKSATILKNGEEFKHTEPSVVLEKMLGDFFSLSNVRGFNKADSYNLVAKFVNVGSLKTNSAVALGGVTVGKVEDIQLDPKRFDAVVTMAISNTIQLPTDTSAAIYSASLLGGQYIGLEPGGEDDVLKDGGEISITQPAMVLEKLIGEYLFNAAAGDTKKTP